MAEDEATTSQQLGIPEPRTFADTHATLQRAVAGSQDAFAELWLRYVPGLEVLLCGRMWRGLGPALRPRLMAEAEDILAQVMASAFHKLGSFTYQGPRSFLAWLCRIAENTLANRIAYWTAQGRDARIEVPVEAPGSSTSPGPRLLARGNGPVTAILHDERRQRVARALATLPERLYTILYWRFFSGAPWEEIAELIGAPSADAARMECFNHALPAFAAALART